MVSDFVKKLNLNVVRYYNIVKCYCKIAIIIIHCFIILIINFNILWDFILINAKLDRVSQFWILHLVHYPLLLKDNLRWTADYIYCYPTTAERKKKQFY